VCAVHPPSHTRPLGGEDFKQFGGIKAKEFLNLAWTKSNKEDLSPHLLAYCRRFNQVTLCLSFGQVDSGLDLVLVYV
jgi:hypothetical protein